MEAFFYFWQQFFSAPAQSPGRDAQQPPQLPGHIGPELPQRPQRRRRQQQIQGHARPGAQQHIQLRLPAAYLGQHPQGPQQAQQGEQPVGGVGQPRPSAPQHPQQIVYQPPGSTQGRRRAQGGQLGHDVVFHGPGVSPAAGSARSLAGPAAPHRSGPRCARPHGAPRRPGSASRCAALGR